MSVSTDTRPEDGRGMSGAKAYKFVDGKERRLHIWAKMKKEVIIKETGIETVGAYPDSDSE